ncbi:hypothetical protein BH09BAC2_BH09BAC2_15880 [soil metagenome]
MINKILELSFFKSNPPVLMDIGASGEINSKWLPIAEKSVCICFDADDREFSVTEQASENYKKLIKINRVVTSKNENEDKFYLTASPFCSSTLKPDSQSLKPWLFRSYFNITKTVSVKAISVEAAMSEIGIEYIDWFKTDTQGTDLRLYQSLPDKVKKSVITAEFEPGIIDAYIGEDKLHHILKELHNESFWLSDISVKGTQRIKEELLKDIPEYRIKAFIKESPCWAELTFFRQPELLSKRQLWLMIIFALLEKQYGFVLEICDVLHSKHPEPLIAECRNYIFSYLKNKKIKVSFKKRVLNLLYRISHSK